MAALEHWAVHSPKGSSSIASPAAWCRVGKSTLYSKTWWSWYFDGCEDTQSTKSLFVPSILLYNSAQLQLPSTLSSSNIQKLWKNVEDPAGGRHLSLLLVLSCESRQESLFSTWGRCSSAMEKNYRKTLPATNLLKLHRTSNCPFFFFWGLNFQFCSQTITIILCNGICSCLLVSCCVSFAAVWCT